MDEVTLPTVGLIVEVHEQIFRISRTTAERFGVVRVADNVRIGTFTHANGELSITAENMDLALMAEIAAVGIRRGL